ncbi:MAG: RagB/SusD family nutrient uptake outer membrane protein, partial [Bacteroidota bacterium]|nr:RagB/SusD family nutrient uptake outer membrane protein [Bacteroidota bacterium]
LLIDVDGYNTGKFFINKECLLGDLHLWRGNYVQAASHYKVVLETASDSGSDSERYDVYRVKYAEIASNNDLAVGYIRYREQDAQALINNNTQGWRSMFSREPDALWNTEWIWSLPFDSSFAPENPFINLFSNQNGNYLLKPSQEAMNLWEDQTQLNGFPYDARGSKFSYSMINGDPVIMKYLYNYLDPVSQLPVDVFQRDGRWFLYRAAKLHLRYAEAANRDGQHRLADALLNYGLQNEYTVEGVEDVTDIEQTNLPFPYDFDARQGDFPFYRGNWYRNGGLRGRAYLERAPVYGDSLISIENNLIEEAALELAFEGNRWGDLVRVAIHRNDPAFLADKIYAKLNAQGNAEASAVRTKLMSQENWYLPFVWNDEE